jgi:hypothetical protein
MYVTLFESSAKESANQKWQQYYFQDKEGLKLYAYYQNPGPIIFGKSAAGFYNGPEFSMEGFLEFLPPDHFNDIDIHITEWIAREGLIQRIVEIGRAKVVNLDGEYLYSAESKEVLQLVDLYLN